MYGSPMRVKIKGCDQDLIMHENLKKMTDCNFIMYKRNEIDVMKYLMYYDHDSINNMSEYLGVPKNFTIGIKITILFLIRKSKLYNTIEWNYELLNKSRNFFKKNIESDRDISIMYAEEMGCITPKTTFENLKEIIFFENVFTGIDPKIIYKITDATKNICFKNKQLFKSPYHYCYNMYKKNRDLFVVLFNIDDNNITEISKMHNIKHKNYDQIVTRISKIYLDEYPRPKKFNNLNYIMSVEPVGEIFKQHLNSKEGQIFIYDYEKVLDSHSLYYNNVLSSSIFYPKDFQFFIDACKKNKPIIFVEEKEDSIEFVKELFDKFKIKAYLIQMKTCINREKFIHSNLKEQGWKNINEINFTSGNHINTDNFLKYYQSLGKIKKLKLHLVSLENEIFRERITL